MCSNLGFKLFSRYMTIHSINYCICVIIFVLWNLCWIDQNVRIVCHNLWCSPNGKGVQNRYVPSVLLKGRQLLQAITNKLTLKDKEQFWSKEICFSCIHLSVQFTYTSPQTFFELLLHVTAKSWSWAIGKGRPVCKAL